MPVTHELHDRIVARYPGDWLVIENESHRHNVPIDSQTHFKVTLVSAQFEGVSRVKRHQALYQLLDDLLAGPIHALALHLHTPDEWQNIHESVPDSPDCLGGGRG